jgi:class 3 adenylate cyclase
MAEQHVERRLAAVLAADVVGYSRLMASDEEGTLARLNALRRQFLEPTIAEHRGRIVKRTGDGLLIEFGSAIDATRCAVQTQQGMAKRNENVPADQRIDIALASISATSLSRKEISSAMASTLPRASKASRSPAAFQFQRMLGGRCRAR